MSLMTTGAKDKQKRLVPLLLAYSLKQVKPVCLLGQTSFLCLQATKFTSQLKLIFMTAPCKLTQVGRTYLTELMLTKLETGSMQSKKIIQFVNKPASQTLHIFPSTPAVCLLAIFLFI